jgi:hypothetical protein
MAHFPHNVSPPLQSVVLQCNAYARYYCLQFLLIKYDYLNTTNTSTASSLPSSFNLSTFTPDNTTIFTKKGDLLSLGDITLPADEDIDPQRVLNPSGAQEGVLSPDGRYVGAEGVLEELTRKMNQPVAGVPGSEIEKGRIAGVTWTVPQPKPLSGE